MRDGGNRRTIAGSELRRWQTGGARTLSSLASRRVANASTGGWCGTGAALCQTSCRSQPSVVLVHVREKSSRFRTTVIGRRELNAEVKVGRAGSTLGHVQQCTYGQSEIANCDCSCPRAVPTVMSHFVTQISYMGTVAASVRDTTVHIAPPRCRCVWLRKQLKGTAWLSAVEQSK